MHNPATKNYYTIGLLVLFVAIVSAIYLNDFYKKDIDILNKRIFPTTDGATFTIFSGNRADAKKGGISIDMALKPGAVFHGMMALKNHDKKESHTYGIGITQDETKKDGITDLNPVLFQLEKHEIRVDPEGVVFIPYTLRIPQDMKQGKYRAIAAAQNIDPNTKKLNSGGIELNMAQGFHINITIDNNATQQSYIDLSKQARDIAMQLVIDKARLIAGITLAIACICLLLLHFFTKKKS